VLRWVGDQAARFAGALSDVNGIPPFRFNIGGQIRTIDTNLFLGTILMVVNLIAVALLALVGR
jgi:hypothetical protein